MTHRVACIALVLSNLGVASAQVGSFSGLGPAAPQEDITTYVTDVSADGAVVVGYYQQYDIKLGLVASVGFSWRSGSGFQFIPDSRTVQAISSNGLVAGGSYSVPQPPYHIVPFLHVNGMPAIIGGGVFDIGEVQALNSTGSVAVGSFSTWGGNPAQSIAFRWSPSTGTQTLPKPAGSLLAAALGISNDGSIIVGYTGTTPLDDTAAAWYGNQFVSLGYLGTPTGTHLVSRAHDISDDGTTIVGSSIAADGAVHAFLRWPDGALHPLPVLPGYTGGEALAVSRDGSVIVGTATGGSPHQIAYYWDRVRGKRDLKQFLTSLGVPGLSGWTLYSATAISPDGAHIVGNGKNPQGTNEGWIAHIPAFCYANCDGSIAAPALNVADFTCFMNRFAAGDPYANCDNSSTDPYLNVADFMCYLTKYAAGCS